MFTPRAKYSGRYDHLWKSHLWSRDDAATWPDCLRSRYSEEIGVPAKAGVAEPITIRMLPVHLCDRGFAHVPDAQGHEADQFAAMIAAENAREEIAEGHEFMDFANTDRQVGPAESIALVIDVNDLEQKKIGEIAYFEKEVVSISENAWSAHWSNELTGAHLGMTAWEYARKHGRALIVTDNPLEWIHLSGWALCPNIDLPLTNDFESVAELESMNIFDGVSKLICTSRDIANGLAKVAVFKADNELLHKIFVADQPKDVGSGAAL